MTQSNKPPFFEPKILSPEHAKQYERFTGVPYNAEAIASTKKWIASRIRNKNAMDAADAAAGRVTGHVELVVIAPDPPDPPPRSCTVHKLRN